MASQENSSLLSACLCIVESSSVSKFAVTSGFIWQLVAQKPKLANAHCIYSYCRSADLCLWCGLKLWAKPRTGLGFYLDL
jgi:hypothetical protein